MGVKKWSDFQKDEKTNEKMKTFSGKKSEEKEVKETEQRGQASSSSEYADEVNQNIIKQKQRMPRKKSERKYTTRKVGQSIKDKSILPQDTEDRGVANMGDSDSDKEVKEGKVEIFGKVAKFPEGVKASKAFNWMHNLQSPKLSKKDIWYLMVEKQDNELQMIKYQQKSNVNLTKFVTDLKNYYMDKYKANEKLVNLISKIELGGDVEGNISAIRNIPNVVVENNRKLIHKLMEDLVRLLG